MFHETYQRIESVLQEITGIKEVGLIEGGDHADFASTIAFSLSREKKRSPVQIATEIATELEKSEKLAGLKVETKGPYINFIAGDDYLKKTLQAACCEGYGSFTKRGVRVVLEHTSANPNGPLHVGHIRNTIIGDTLARAFRKAGFQLEVQYYVNNIGRQIAIVVWGLDNLNIEQGESEKSDHFIARAYIEANKKISLDDGITSQIDHLMQKVEALEPDTTKKFLKAVSTCLNGFQTTLQDLNAKHDRFVSESDFIRNGDTERLVGKLRRLPECHTDGRMYLDLSKEGFEKEYVIVRSDGTSVYAARDLAYHIWKGRNFDRVIDVLGADHKLIGSQLITTLRLIGEKYPEIVHFEFVSLPDGAMSTRAGKFISADELILETRKRALEEVKVRRPELGSEDLEKISQSVALAAIRYDIVKVSPEKNTVFNWEDALNFERQSGPYIQYAYARASSILLKAGEFSPLYQAIDQSEIAVVKHIAKFPFVIERTIIELRPHLLATYARELADLFNSFYHDLPVLKADEIERRSRLTIVKATSQTLREVLAILGIDALTTM